MGPECENREGGRAWNRVNEERCVGSIKERTIGVAGVHL